MYYQIISTKADQGGGSSHIKKNLFTEKLPLGKVLEVGGKVLPITFKSGKSFENSEKGFSPKIPRERKGKERLSVLLYKILVVFEVR